MQNDKENNGKTTPKITSHEMPTFGDIMKNINKSQHTDKKEFVSRMVEKMSQGAEGDFSTEVPSFNLGQQILSQQRKVASLKRKSPVSPGIIPVNTKQFMSAKIESLPPMPEPPPSPQQRIIADIIAKEIRLLTTVR